MTGKLRPGPGEDAKAWTRGVFAAGDYAGAAMFGDPSAWQFHAARAMLRGDEASFAALRQFDGTEPRFHAAAARWIHGDTARARQELSGIDHPHAHGLARLLAQDRIRVLAQLPWLPGAMTDLAAGARADRHFEVRTIGRRAGDVPERPYADVAQLLADGFTPDFHVATMVEWHHLPPNLQTLGCPLFGHIADHDLHIQTIRPWLDLFDELCVTDRTEWLDVQGLGRGPVSSFPHVFGMPAQLPPLVDGARHLDFFVSGTMLDPYHPDKARVLHELLAMPDIALRVVRGFTGPLAFYALLAASKASFTFVRRPGAMPTRGLESLAMGCAVALQEQSILNLWVGPDEGVVTYGARRGELAAAVRRIVDDWGHFGPAARAGAGLVREQFAMPRVASRYLRFLAFRAAAPRMPRQPLDTSAWCQKRLCVSRTWLPDDPMVRRRTMQANFRRLQEVVARRPSPGPIVDMARELLCEFVFYEQKGQAEADERTLHADGVRLLETCCRLFPDHLAARFLLVRTLWHHGDAKARMQALQLAHDTLEADPGRWRIGPADDVMPFDFHADCFNYRDYFDLVAKAEKGGVVPTAHYVRLIRASLAGYLARKTGKPALHELAASLDPAFARYRLDFARCLLRRGGEADRTRARTLLLELAEGSAEFAAAARDLLRGWPDAANVVTAATARAVRRMDEDTIDASLCVQSLFALERREAKVAALAGARGPAGLRGTGVAVLVPSPGDVTQLANLLADLDGQTCAADLEVVVAAGPGHGLPPGVPDNGAARRRTVPVAEDAGWVQRLNACAQAAASPYAIVAMPGDRLRADALETLRRELDDHGDTALVFASEGWSAGEVSRFDPSACVGFSCPPPHAHRRLATTNVFGFHVLWRRALHERHGWFDAAFGAAAEYEFWLRLGAVEVRQLPLLLTASCLSALWRRDRDAVADLAAVERARRLHVPHDHGPFQPRHLLPATLLAPGIREEATSHARLGVISDVERRDLASLEQFLGTALLHGDSEIALCLLRAATAGAPRLLAPRLAYADLLAALGLPVRDVLLAARSCHPYEALLAQRLARAGCADALVPVPPPRPRSPTPPCPV